LQVWHKVIKIATVRVRSKPETKEEAEEILRSADFTPPQRLSVSFTGKYHSVAAYLFRSRFRTSLRFQHWRRVVAEKTFRNSSRWKRYLIVGRNEEGLPDQAVLPGYQLYAETRERFGRTAGDCQASGRG
jgi:hypothetical protein